MAIDTTGNVYISDTGDNCIQKFSPNGRVLASRGVQDNISSPEGLAVDSSGDICVANWENDRVDELTPTGVVYDIWGHGEPASGVHLYHPRAVALDAQGNLYVAGSGASCLHELRVGGESPLLRAPWCS